MEGRNLRIKPPNTEEVMKATTKLALAAAFAATAFAGTASAEGTVIHTRSPEAAHADLVRDWSFNGGGNAGEVRQRTSAEMRADLVRDWNAKPAAEVPPPENKTGGPRAARP